MSTTVYSSIPSTAPSQVDPVEDWINFSAANRLLRPQAFIYDVPLAKVSRRMEEMESNWRRSDIRRVSKGRQLKPREPTFQEQVVEEEHQEKRGSGEKCRLMMEKVAGGFGELSSKLVWEKKKKMSSVVVPHFLPAELRAAFVAAGLKQEPAP